MCLVAIIASGTVACGDSKDTTAPTASVGGTYARQILDRRVIPTEIFNGPASDATTGRWYDGFIATINAGTLELDPRAHYNSTFVYTLVHDGVAENSRTVWSRSR